MPVAKEKGCKTQRDISEGRLTQPVGRDLLKFSKGSRVPSQLRKTYGCSGVRW